MVTFFTYTAVLLMIFSPVLLAVLLRRRVEVHWHIFLLGALTFSLSQMVHLPLNHFLEEWGVLVQRSGLEGAALWRTALVGGLTAGVCEELARFGAYQWMKRRGIEDGVMLGIGHGGIESMIFGGVLTAATVGALSDLQGVDPGSLDLLPSQLEVLEMQMDVFVNHPWTLIFAWLERMIAMGLHISLSVLLWKAVVEKKPLLIGLAAAYHMAVDTAAILASHYGLIHWQINIVFLLISLPLYIWALRQWRQFRPSPRSRGRQEYIPAFIAACRKELLEQIRTRRFLIFVSVFAGFGILSPLFARFMPELIGSIEEAREFVHLIPEPTAADSYTQYVKNISQFGFILVLLMGMGAVAGEQERGTAAMVLSKPMPRWLFVFSKLLIQMLVYAVSLLIAFIFTFGYTWVLFGPQDVGPFVLINLLLFLWLMTFAGIALVGSSLGKTTAAAAGFGMAGMVLLLVLGGVPIAGQLAPGGLIVWANQLAVGKEITTNGGAAAMAGVLIVLSMLGSIAAMERKEI